MHTLPTVVPLLTRRQAADFLGVKPQTLAVWHSVGRYDLPTVKVGRSARYRIADLETFCEQRTRRHSGEAL